MGGWDICQERDLRVPPVSIAGSPVPPARSGPVPGILPGGPGFSPYGPVSRPFRPWDVLQGSFGLLGGV